MIAALAMPSDCFAHLKGLVFASVPAQRDALINALERSDQLECIDTPDNLAELRDTLQAHAYDLAVIIVDQDEQRLPVCLLRYPDLQVLAVTTRRKTGSIDSWRRQGANDVVSSQRQNKLQLALERMLEGCLTRSQLRLAMLKLASQDRLHKILLDTQAEAVMLWQNENVVESNACLDYLIGCTALSALATDWQQWLSKQSYAEIHRPLHATSDDVVITSAIGQKYRARVEHLALDSGPAILIRINPRPIDPSSWRDEQNDSVTGVLRRESFVTHLDSWLQSSRLPRYTVVQISIEIPDALQVAGSANSTLQELLAYRAANLLQQQFQDQMLLGRTGPTTLTLVSCQSVEDSRNLAMQLRRCLGTVGDLVDDPHHIRIKTLTLSPSALSAERVLNRLELHPLMKRRTRRQRTRRHELIASSLGA